MAELYPPIEPYDHGMLDVGDGNFIYWEACICAHYFITARHGLGAGPSLARCAADSDRRFGAHRRKTMKNETLLVLERFAAVAHSRPNSELSST
jgi:hypothetical protein